GWGRRGVVACPVVAAVGAAVGKGELAIRVDEMQRAVETTLAVGTPESGERRHAGPRHDRPTLLSGVHICAKFVQYRDADGSGLAAADKSAGTPVKRRWRQCRARRPLT